MSNAQLMMSLAGISGGFGKAGRAPAGVAKERLHLKNLQPWERDAAKSEYEQIVADQKAARAAAIAEWFNRYPAAMPVEYKKIDKVVAKFLVGQPAEAAASGVSTDGGSLVVQGTVVASRNSANDRFFTVCPGLFGESKASRYAANSALRHMGAGIRVTDLTRGMGDEGFAFFSPSRSPRQGRILVPDRCMRVEVSKKMREQAIEAAYGSEMIGPQQMVSRDAAEPVPMAPSRPAKHHRHHGRSKTAAGKRNPLKQVEAMQKDLLIERGMSPAKAAAEAKKYVASQVASLKAKAKAKAAAAAPAKKSSGKKKKKK